jgi:hypothetical protein
MKSFFAGLVFVLVILPAGIHTTSAAEKKNGNKAEKVEPALPPDAAALKIIESLGENQCARLPETRIVGEWNELTRKFGMHKRGPSSRNYCNKLIWAPERRRALFCGANHGSPHRMNDVWEFDLAANAWILLYPPDVNNRRNVLTKEILLRTTEIRDGVHVTKAGGGPVELAHQWWQVTYDPELKALAWMCGSIPPVRRKLWRQLPDADESRMYAGPPFWLYVPGEKRWVFPKAPKPYPEKQIVASLVEYVPELGGCLYHCNKYGNNQTWLFSSKTRTWKNLNPRIVKGSMPSQEMVSCWDSANKVLVVHSGDAKNPPVRTNHYDPKANAWTLAVESKKPGTIPPGRDTYTCMHFDPVARVCLLMVKPRGGKKGKPVLPMALWTYDAAAKKWSKLSPEGAWPPEWHKSSLGWFDPRHNVFVFNTRTQTWVYRHKKAGK